MTASSDLAFRPPVPIQQLPQHLSGGRDDATSTQQGLLQHDARLKPHLSILLVSCRVLGLSMETTFSAACLLHRYVLSLPSFEVQQVLPTVTSAATATHKVNNHNQKQQDTADDWPWRVASVIFIACKAEEEHRRLRDLINLVHMLSWKKDNSTTTPTPTSNKDETSTPLLLSTSDEQAKTATRKSTDNHHPDSDDTPFSSSSSSSETSMIELVWNNQPPDLDEQYWKDKERIVKAEQTVLRWLAFDVHVAHPHRLVVLLTEDCLEQYIFTSTISNAEDDIEKQQSQSTTKILVENTWTLLNSCVFSINALQQSTLTLAVAALDHTIDTWREANAKKNASTISIPTGWWKATGVSLDDKKRAMDALDTVISMN